MATEVLPRCLFVGEARSPMAKKMNVHWKDGRLAAKQLFDALHACGVDPSVQRFENWFDHHDHAALARSLRCLSSRGWVVVALGNKVAAALTVARVPHRPMIHPAARGAIRRKDRYAEHVKGVLGLEEREECV